MEIKGHKIVEGRSITKWKPTAAKALSDKAELWERKLVGITEARKILGKELEQYTEKPPGKPALVPMDDRRKPITNDFERISE